MAKAYILLNQEPQEYNECPLSKDNGWGCKLMESHESCPAHLRVIDECYFTFSKCPFCKAQS